MFSLNISTRCRHASEIIHPDYHPWASEVPEAWRRLHRVTTSNQTIDWLRYCSLEPDQVVNLDLARTCAPETLLDWATMPARPSNSAPPKWTEAGYTLIYPAYDSAGQMVSLHAFNPERTSHDDAFAVPRDDGRGNVVMADGLGQQLLLLGQRPGWWEEDVPLRVVICTGALDYLVWSTRLLDSGLYAVGHEPAVLGATLSGWSQAIADRVPDGATVVVAVPPKLAAGDLEKRITATFAVRMRQGRIALESWKWK
jgi:hypothetical protein